MKRCRRRLEEVVLELARSLELSDRVLPAGTQGRLHAFGGHYYDLHSVLPFDGVGVPHDALLVVHAGSTTPLSDRCRSGQLVIRCRTCYADVFSPERRPSLRTTLARVAACERRQAQAREDARIVRDEIARTAELAARLREERLRGGLNAALESERTFLGALLLSPVLIRRRACVHEGNALIAHAHELVLDAIDFASIKNRDKPVTCVSVCAELEGAGRLGIVGGRVYVERLVTPRPALDVEVERLARTYGGTLAPA